MSWSGISMNDAGDIGGAAWHEYLVHPSDLSATVVPVGAEGQGILFNLIPGPGPFLPTQPGWLPQIYRRMVETEVG